MSVSKQLKFVSIPTSDQDRALAFWTEKVGLRVATDQPMGGQRWIELSIPGAETESCCSRRKVRRTASAASSTARWPATTSSTAIES
jgi:catechol 2,3-dioxygenase-like lactoylglutathione lyase family enzyme